MPVSLRVQNLETIGYLGGYLNLFNEFLGTRSFSPVACVRPGVTTLPSFRSAGRKRELMVVRVTINVLAALAEAARQRLAQIESCQWPTR